MTNSHGTLRSMGVNFDTDRKMSIEERAKARQRLVAGVLGKKASQVPRLNPETPEDRRAKLLKEAEDRRTLASAQAALKSQRCTLTLYEQHIDIQLRELARLEATIDDLCAVIGEADEDIATLAGMQDRDLAGVVRSYLSARHKKYPGVQKDLAALIQQLAILSGWFDEDDG